MSTAVAALFVALSLAYEFLLRRFYQPLPMVRSRAGHGHFDPIWWDLGQDTALAIAALWVVLALDRRWRASPDWIDRLGRLIGAAWVVTTIAALLLMYVLMSRQVGAPGLARQTRSEGGGFPGIPRVVPALEPRYFARLQTSL